MTEQQRKNRRAIILIFAMSIIPFCIAWYLSKNPALVATGTNNGILITPAVTTERSEMTGFDEFSTANMKELSGRWVLVNVIPDKECNKVCIEAMHKTRQLRLMLSKDLTRVRRVTLLFKDSDPETAKNWWQEDKRLLRAKPAQSLIAKFKTITQDNLTDGMLFLMDPFGNIMMRYETGFDPYEVKRDLQKLLRISQIG